MAEAAKASILWQKAASAGAEAAAVDRWEGSQRDAARQPLRTNLVRDLAAIRDLIVQPPAGSLLGRFVRNAVHDQRTTGPVLVVDPDVRVRLADQRVRRVTLYQQFSGAEHVVFLTAEQRAALSGIVATLDGRRQPSPGDTSGRAAGTANHRPLLVRNLCNRVFPSGWFQTPGQSAPTIVDIEFLNAD